MTNVEGDTQRLLELHEELAKTQAEAPQFAIRPCVGRGGKFAKSHKPFVVKEKLESGGWKDESAAEFDSLDEALEFPNARAFFSSTVCNACKNLCPN